MRLLIEIFMIKKILLSAALLLSSMHGMVAQKQYTIEEAVLGLSTNLRIEQLPQLGFRPGTTQITQVVTTGDESYYTLTHNNLKVDTLISLSELKSILGKEAVTTMPMLQWMDQKSLYFRTKQQLVLWSNVQNKKTIKQWYELPEKAQNVVIDKFGNIVYTIDNNLYWVREGNVIQVTKDTHPNVLNGHSVHRNEFGINGGIFLSPQGNRMAFYRMDESMIEDYPIIDWTSMPAKNKNIKYPMAGGNNPEVSLGVYHPRTKKTVFLSTPQPLKDYYLTSVTWSPDELSIYVAVLTRNQRQLQLHQYDASTGRLVKIHFHESHDKYVEPQHPLYFLPGNQSFLWWSQRDGYMHLYKYSVGGKLEKQLTKGEWIVKGIHGVNERNQELIISTTLGSPLETSIYAVNYVSGKMRKLNQDNGMHSIKVSDNGLLMIDQYRNANTPTNIDVIHTVNASKRNILIAKNPLKDYANATVKPVMLKADDGTDLYGKLMLPHDFDPNKKYPVIVYLYNGPHLQLINNSFPASGNLWYDYMTQHGYIVFSMDGRGSANRGLAFEQAIHNQLGTVEMEDQLKGVEYLKSLPYVDAGRLGVHGWSYGGFMTTSLMTRYPDVFKVGVAGGPVIDWKMYEVMYTERYMSSPQDNPSGYANNSLLQYAKNLKGKLLMIHGTDDDVVVWQHSLNFIKQCVDDKVQVDYFAYPAHAHNVRGKDRVHLMDKISQYFFDNL